MAEPDFNPKRMWCKHLQPGAGGHTESVHRVTPESSSRSGLHTVTKLCAVCSAQLANFLRDLERRE